MSELQPATDIDAPFVLRRHDRPVPGDLRILRRMAILTLLLDACWDSRASIQQLHVLNWAIRSKESREAFLSFLEGSVPPDQAVVRYDPSLVRVMDFARHERLVRDREEPNLDSTHERMPSSSTSYRIALSDKGHSFAAMLTEENYLVSERLFLERIGKKVTQKMVESLLDWR
jgi:hypothetical protein